MNKQLFLAMSLRCGLKFDIQSDLYKYPTLTGIRRDYLEFNYHGTYLSFHNDFIGKPILRPLSDLKDDYWFDKIESFACDLLDAASVYNQNTIDKIDFYKTEFAIIIKLVEWHFDICGLIEIGEAIDYHTLPDFVF